MAALSSSCPYTRLPPEPDTRLPPEPADSKEHSLRTPTIPPHIQQLIASGCFAKSFWDKAELPVRRVLSSLTFREMSVVKEGNEPISSLPGVINQIVIGCVTRYFQDEPAEELLAPLLSQLNKNLNLIQHIVSKMMDDLNLKALFLEAAPEIRALWIQRARYLCSDIFLLERFPGLGIPLNQILPLLKGLSDSSRRQLRDWISKNLEPQITQELKGILYVEIGSQLRQRYTLDLPNEEMHDPRCWRVFFHPIFDKVREEYQNLKIRTYALAVDMRSLYCIRESLQSRVSVEYSLEDQSPPNLLVHLFNGEEVQQQFLDLPMVDQRLLLHLARVYRKAPERLLVGTRLIVGGCRQELRKEFLQALKNNPFVMELREQFLKELEE